MPTRAIVLTFLEQLWATELLEHSKSYTLDAQKKSDFAIYGEVESELRIVGTLKFENMCNLEKFDFFNRVTKFQKEDTGGPQIVRIQTVRFHYILKWN